MSHLMDMMNQVKRLRNGAGVQYLLDEAYKIMGNPIIMFNTEYNLLAYTNVATDDPVWNELITYGTFRKEMRSFLESEGFTEDVANAPKVTLLKSEKLKYERLSGKLFNKNNSFVSNLVIVACNKPFEEYDPVVFEAVCRLVTKEISKSEFYLDYELAYQETVIRNLIDRDYNVKPDISQVGSLYDSLESNLYIAVADVSACSPEYTNIAYFKVLFKQIKPAYKYAVYSDYIVMIISTNDDALNVNKDLGGLIKIFEQNNIYAGISSRFENLYELGRYYSEALRYMQYAANCKSTQRIFPYGASAINKIQQIDALENGLGIQYFLNKGLEIFGNPLLFHDMEPKLLGYTENVEIIDPIWQELIAYGIGSDETVELFRTEGWVDIMDKTKGGALLVSDKCKYDRISWRIYNNDNIRFGCTSIVNTMKPFSEDELVLFGTFSQRFSKEVKKIEFYNKIGQVYSGTIINRLISGKIDDSIFYSEDIGNLYDNLMENLCLAVIDTTHCKSEQINLTYIRNLFNRPGTVNRYVIYDDYIVIIISIDDASLNKNSILDEINRIFEQKNIYAGISSRFENIYELQKYYLQAVEVLKDGLKNKQKYSKQRIFHYQALN